MNGGGSVRFALSVLYVAFIGILFFFIGEALPRRAFHEDQFPFCSFRFEKGGKIYDKIYIRKWKSRLPDMSKIMKDMLPKTVNSRAGANDLQKLIKETCVAEFVHFCLCIFSVGVYFFWKNSIGIFLTALSVLGNIPFILIQRFNRPHLVCIRDKMIAREERKKHANTDIVG